jgi:hypothetical protein
MEVIETRPSGEVHTLYARAAGILNSELDVEGSNPSATTGLQLKLAQCGINVAGHAEVVADGLQPKAHPDKLSTFRP